MFKNNLRRLPRFCGKFAHLISNHKTLFLGISPCHLKKYTLNGPFWYLLLIHRICYPVKAWFVLLLDFQASDLSTWNDQPPVKTTSPLP